MIPERVYVHGGGRRGADAWPHVSASEATFVSFPPGSSISEQSATLARDLGGRPLLIFAHSIGAVPVVRAAATLDVAGLVLIEPALYDIARGDAAVERHIGIVVEARALAAAGDLRGFWAILRPLMFGGAFEEARWDQEKPLAERWATADLPWGHGVRERLLDAVPTLVVTGGWNDEYEAIAAVLVAVGAQHLVLRGAQHRPQDLAPFPAAVETFARSLWR